MKFTCLKQRFINKKRAQGFTLVETLIYIGIISIFLMSVISFTTSAMAAGNKARVQHEIQQNARFAMDRMVREIRQSDGINVGASNFGIYPGVLSLTNGVGSTVFDVSAGVLRINEGVGAQDLTTNEVQVTNLVFENKSKVGRIQIVTISMTITWANPESYDFDSTVTVRSSAVVRAAEE